MLLDLSDRQNRRSTASAIVLRLMLALDCAQQLQLGQAAAADVADFISGARQQPHCHPLNQGLAAVSQPSPQTILQDARCSYVNRCHCAVDLPHYDCSCLKCQLQGVYIKGNAHQAAQEAAAFSHHIRSKGSHAQLGETSCNLHSSDVYHHKDPSRLVL